MSISDQSPESEIKHLKIESPADNRCPECGVELVREDFNYGSKLTKFTIKCPQGCYFFGGIKGDGRVKERYSNQ